MASMAAETQPRDDQTSETDRWNMSSEIAERCHEFDFESPYAVAELASDQHDDEP
jgi:hypothetical protein